MTKAFTIHEALALIMTQRNVYHLKNGEQWLFGRLDKKDKDKVNEWPQENLLVIETEPNGFNQIYRTLKSSKLKNFKISGSDEYKNNGETELLYMYVQKIKQSKVFSYIRKSFRKRNIRK